MRWITMAAGAACGVLLSTGAQAQTPQDGPARITNPDWARRPSGDDVARYYPERAARLGLGGRATIVCKVRVDGSLTDCSVASEEPAGAGFGEATLKLAPMFRMTPQTRDGIPVDGASVRIPVVYSLPKVVRPASAPMPPINPLVIAGVLGGLLGGGLLLVVLIILWDQRRPKDL